MIIKCYSVLDHKVKQHRLCIFQLEHAAAIRDFTDEVNNDKNPWGWNRHPEDYSLWFVGEFDTEKGELKDYVKENLVNALAVKRVEIEELDGYGNRKNL